MKTLPCHGCSDRGDPNCIENCASYNVWAKERYRKAYSAMIEEDRIQALDQNYMPDADSESYYEPCDETGEPYKKGDLDKKFGRYK